MKLRRNRVVLVGITVVGALLLVVAFALQRDSSYPVEGRLVILDPGHFETPDDTGALNLVGRIWLEERDVNWEVAHATQRRLAERGVRVVFTRQAGQFIDRPARYRLADASGGEVLISIHHNGADDHRINYTTTYFTHNADISIAQRVQDRLAAALEFDDGDIRRETFGMTANTTMPAALTEAWFITHNGTAARYLAEQAMRTSTAPGMGWPTGSLVELEAEALASALIDWLASQPPPASQ